MLKKVEIRPAYAWICDDCGVENLLNGILIDSKDINNLDSEFLEYDFDTEVFMGIPSEVECPHCKSIFATIHFLEDFDEQD